MIALDTNILVHAHRRHSPWHSPASTVVREIAESQTPWAIPWPCIHEFYAVVTNARLFESPTTESDAVRQLEAWMASPSIHLIGELSGHWEVVKPLLIQGRIKGGAVHDARIAAICLSNGVSELLTADRDFSRFPKLKTRNPLV